MFCSFYCRKEHQNCTFCWISIGIHICIPWFRWSDNKTWYWEGVRGLHHKEKTQYWSIIVNVHFYDWRHFKLIGKSGSLFCWPSCLFWVGITYSAIFPYFSFVKLLVLNWLNSNKCAIVLVHHNKLLNRRFFLGWSEWNQEAENCRDWC